jgi:hypothetical protein
MVKLVNVPRETLAPAAGDIYTGFVQMDTAASEVS